jgi:hypothetical protein
MPQKMEQMMEFLVTKMESEKKKPNKQDRRNPR